MKHFIHSGEYYLKKIQLKEMTKAEVAQLLNVSAYDVSIAYSKFIHSQNPFNSRKIDFKFIAEIAVSLLSTILVLLTLFEMQRERDTAYTPDIVIETVSSGMAWNNIGKLCSKEEYESGQSFFVGDWDDPSNFINTPPVIRVYNIGAGNAKKINVEWAIETDVQAFLDVFQKNGLDGEIVGPDNISANKSVRFANKSAYFDEGVYYGLPIGGDGLPFDAICFDYLLSSAQDNQSIVFPKVYYWLIQKLTMLNIDTAFEIPLDEYNITEDENAGEIPAIHLSASYYDIQGHFHQKRFEIITHYTFLYGNPGSIGSCSFDLIPREIEPK